MFKLLITRIKPTAGMDPAARRYIWNIIKVAREMGTTILLTTHRFFLFIESYLYLRS